MEAQFDIRLARAEDLDAIEAVRAAAFAPVFASFRELLGDDIYRLAQERDDAAQGALLASFLADEATWSVFVAQLGDELVGFVSVRLDHERRLGEIGLNAVAPAHAGRGIGSGLYEHALAVMKDAGMLVATVSTGGDPSHAPARRAYEKVGFAAQIPSVWMCRRL